MTKTMKRRWSFYESENLYTSGKQKQLDRASHSSCQPVSSPDVRKLSVSAIHVEEHLDRRTPAIRCHHGFDLFHQSCLAGRSANAMIADTQATIAIALVGICWAIACWV